MSKTLSEFKAKYPALYSHLEYWQCSDGWNELIDQLSQVLDREIQMLDPESHNHSNYHAVQVKSKFGGLRFYMSNSTPAMNGAIDLAECLSLRLCEKCGLNTANSFTIKGVVWTLCNECFEENK